MLPRLLLRQKSQQGSAGIMALLVMTVLLTVGSGLIARSSIESKISSSYTDGVAAQYLAESGIQHAKAEIQIQKYVKNIVNSKLQHIPLGKGYYDVTVTYIDDFHYKVISIGTVNNARRQIVAIMKKNTVYDFAVYGTGKDDISKRGVSLYPSSRVDGDIGSAHKLVGIESVRGNEENMRAFDKVEYSTKDKTNISEMAKEIARIPNLGHPDTICCNYDLNEKSYYYEKDFHLYNYGEYHDTITGPGTIVIKGNFYIQPGCTVVGDVLIMTTGSIFVGDGNNFPATVNKAILIANENIFINNNGNINKKTAMIGAAIAGNKVTVYDNGRITYDETLIERFMVKNQLPPTYANGLRIVHCSNSKINI